MKIRQSGASATVVRAILSVLFLGSAIFVIRYNLQQIIENPTLGVDHTYNRRAELVREIEGVDKPGKEEWISLAFGDGMRFFAFLANHLPEDAVLIFPRDDAGYIKPTQYFRIGSGAIKVRDSTRVRSRPNTTTILNSFRTTLIVSPISPEGTRLSRATTRTAADTSCSRRLFPRRPSATVSFLTAIQSRSTRSTTRKTFS